MIYRHSKDATVAAAKSGFSRATGYRIEDIRGCHPEESAEAAASDPLPRFGREIVPILKSAPAFGPLHARRDPAAPSAISAGIRRTLERECAAGEPWPAPSRM